MLLTVFVSLLNIDACFSQREMALFSILEDFDREFEELHLRSSLAKNSVVRCLFVTFNFYNYFLTFIKKKHFCQ